MLIYQERFQVFIFLIAQNSVVLCGECLESSPAVAVAAILGGGAVVPFSLLAWSTVDRRK